MDTKLAGMKAIEDTMYVAKPRGEYLAFIRNTVQTALEWDMTKDHSGPEAEAPKKAN